MASKLPWLAASAASFFLVLQLTACSSTPEREEAANIQVSNGVALLDGRISVASFYRLRDAVSDGSVQRLAVNSEGGDPMAAMQIGYLLQREQMTLDIRGACERECANYLFTAAAQRRVYPDAIISWSGGAIEQSVILSWESYILPGIRDFVTRYSDQYLRRETRFFERIGVDQYITSYGFHPRLGCTDSARFYYSWPDLISMGIGPTEFVGRSYARAFEHYPSDICRVDLSNRQLLLEP
ncbi:hypothetical protein [Aliidiomarina sanyensis]|uniref:Alpha/beta hydrolase n=1 Tax=Aliidiomarina sanyensis TaxID=1249555 RepID=A0A432WDP4_9GAMM|nr:hypothetical protein [Aliidiomarina sanyensis]RUO30513.1 hypothetical protein CWE11_09090 [Aliidiomarina sanyensis]